MKALIVVLLEGAFCEGIIYLVKYVKRRRRNESEGK